MMSAEQQLIRQGMQNAIKDALHEQIKRLADENERLSDENQRLSDTITTTRMHILERKRSFHESRMDRGLVSHDYLTEHLDEIYEMLIPKGDDDDRITRHT